MIWTTRQRSKIGPLAAICVGQGPLILLIHGVGLQAEAWAAQIDDLAKSHRVVAVDMPGHGASAGLGDGATLADFSQTIADVIDEPATVIGHSFGAMIALDIATLVPDRVKAVVALNAIYRRSHDAKAAVLARAAALDGKTVADPTATLDRWFGTAASAEKDACRDWLCATDPRGYRQAYRVFADQDGPRDADLAALSCPALFMTGSEEPNSTPAMSRSMAELAPFGQLSVVTGAAHMMPMTHAAQVNATLDDFIKDTGQ